MLYIEFKMNANKSDKFDIYDNLKDKDFYCEDNICIKLIQITLLFLIL